MEVLGEPPNPTDVRIYGSLRVITALEFVEHPFCEVGSQGPPCDPHIIWLKSRLHTLRTRSVRRASGSVQTAIKEACGRVRERKATSLGGITFGPFSPSGTGAPRFAPDPLDNPHPELRLVAYRLRGRNPLRRNDLLGGQAQ